MFCHRCGTKIRHKDIFCPICGLAQKVSVPKNADVEMEGLAEAIRQLKSGNDEGFYLIYFNTYKYVFNRAKYMLKDDQKTQELVQDVYVALYKGITDLKDEKAIYGWLKTVIFRQGLRFLEKQKKLEAMSETSEYVFDILPDERVKIEDSYGKSEDIRTVKRCVDMLSEEQRLVILAYYYDNMSVKEISKVLQISEGTVKSRLYLARKHLLSMLENEEKEQGYKFFGAGLPLLTPALDQALNVNIEIAKKTIITECQNVCRQIEINELFVRSKWDRLLSKVYDALSSVTFKTAALYISGLLIVGAGCGLIFMIGNAAGEIQSSAPEEKKAVKEVKLAEHSETQLTKVVDENEQGAASGSDREAVRTEEDSEGEGPTETVDLGTVAGLNCSYAPNSEDLALSWDPVSGADGYEVYVATSEYPTYKKDSTVNTTKCTVLAGGAYYHVKVRAYNRQGGKMVYGPFCGEISTEPDIVFPQNIKITSVRQDGDYVVVNVDPFTVDYHSEIVLYRATSADGSYKKVGKVACYLGQQVTVNEIYDVWPNEDGQTYYYKIGIKAFKTWPGKSDKYSNYSNVVSYIYRLD